jgi:hypothetical protein
MNGPQVFDLPELPSSLPTFARAGLSVARRLPEAPVLPDWALRVRALRVDRANLTAYNALCGLPQGDDLPMLYPQVLATPLFLHLMTRPGFPVPLLGLVHVRNTVEQRRPLRADESLDLSLRVGEGREVKAGFEFDLHMECAPAGDEPVWRATMTVIRRRPRPSSGPKPPPVVDARLAEYLPFTAPADIGRRYARVSGDYNPIHLYAATARLFGFPRAIAHGLWTAARCLALLAPRRPGPVCAYAVQFKQPLLLPGRAVLRYLARPEQIEFALLSAGAAKVHVSGTLR